MRTLRLITGFTLLLSSISAKDDLVVLGSASAGQGILRAWLTDIAKRQLAARRTELAKIDSTESFELRRKSVREKLARMIGALPRERTPLNLRKTGTLDRGDYTVEKVIYESFPRFYVTANLYVP